MLFMDLRTCVNHAKKRVQRFIQSFYRLYMNKGIIPLYIKIMQKQKQRFCRKAGKFKLQVDHANGFG